MSNLKNILIWLTLIYFKKNHQTEFGYMYHRLQKIFFNNHTLLGHVVAVANVRVPADYKATNLSSSMEASTCTMVTTLVFKLAERSMDRTLLQLLCSNPQFWLHHMQIRCAYEMTPKLYPYNGFPDPL